VSDFFEDAEVLENFAIIAVAGIGLYLIYQVYKAATKNSEAEVIGTQPWIGNGKALTAQQARSIAVLLSSPGDPGAWSQSPDKTQVWFPNGAYYDNSTNHLYDKDGNDQGQALFPNGSVNDQAAHITGQILLTDLGPVPA